MKGANGSCRAVSEFNMKNRDVTAAVQFTAGQSVTLVLLQRRHPASNALLPGLLTEQTPHKQTNIGQKVQREKGSNGSVWLLLRRALFWSRSRYVMTAEEI